jgi:hypothetical protein
MEARSWTDNWKKMITRSIETDRTTLAWLHTRWQLETDLINLTLLVYQMTKKAFHPFSLLTWGKTVYWRHRIIIAIKYKMSSHIGRLSYKNGTVLYSEGGLTFSIYICFSYFMVLHVYLLQIQSHSPLLQVTHTNNENPNSILPCILLNIHPIKWSRRVLGCDTVFRCNGIQSFRRTMLTPSSGWSDQGLEVNIDVGEGV